MDREKTDDWALVQILPEKTYRELRAARAHNIAYLMASGAVYCRVLEWNSPSILDTKPDYETWAANHGFRIIKDSGVVQGLRSQTKADIGTAAWS